MFGWAIASDFGDVRLEGAESTIEALRKLIERHADEFDALCYEEYARGITAEPEVSD